MARPCHYLAPIDVATSNQIEIASLFITGNNEHEHDLWAKAFFFYLVLTRIVNMLTTFPDAFLPNDPTMSTALMQLVPLLDGSNYLPWARSMRAYLKSQGLWAIVNGTERYPIDPNAPKPSPSGTSPSGYTLPKEIEEAQKAYWLKNNAAIGTLMLHLTPAIADMCNSFNGADDIWNHLKREYSTPSLSYAYQQFKIAMNFKIDTSCHPSPQIDYLQGVYSHLDGINIKIPEALQGMMLLNVVPTKWETLVPLILSDTAINNLTIVHIKKFLINWWDNDQNKKSGKPAPAAKIAQKLSAVKRRKSSNTFTSQQASQSSNSKGKAPQGSKPQSKEKPKRGTRAGKGKKREQHVHLSPIH